MSCMYLESVSPMVSCVYLESIVLCGESNVLLLWSPSITDDDDFLLNVEDTA